MRRASVLLAVATGAWLAAAPAHADDKQQCLTASDQGQSLRDDGKYSRAREAFAACSREACPTLVRRDCTKWLAELEQGWPSVVVSARDDKGADLVAVSVRVDGAPLVSKLDGKPTPVDPGAHVFRFEAAGFSVVEQNVVVHAGEKSRLLAVQFGTPAGQPAAGASAAAAPAGAGTKAEPEPGSAPSPRGTRASAWVFGGIALAGFATEAYFGLSGLSDRSNLQHGCGQTQSCSQSSVDAVRTKFTVADIGLGVGLVSAALSAYLFIAAPAKDQPPPPQSQSRLDVAPLPGGAQVSFGGRF
jgi:hypothetical protein